MRHYNDYKTGRHCVGIYRIHSPTHVTVIVALKECMYIKYSMKEPLKYVNNLYKGAMFATVNGAPRVTI